MATTLSTTSARARTAPPRVTVTTLPALDPVQAAQLDPFFDTLYRIACRLVEADTDHRMAPAA